MTVASPIGDLHSSERGDHRAETPYDAVLFDLDAVVANTSAPDAAAWKRLFDAVLHDRRMLGADGSAAFDEGEDYRRYVEGRPGEEGVTRFLGSRGIELPRGAQDDPADAFTVSGLAARKDALFLTSIARHHLRAYPGTIALLTRLRSGRVPVGLVTASRNVAELLASAELVGIFDVVIDGQMAAHLNVPGAPHPAMFLEAVHRLGVSTRRTALVVGAVAGAQAGRRGGLGLIVGIDRAGHRDELESAGADVVLRDVAELDLGASRTDPWMLVYDGFDPAHEGHREVLTALGNGYMVTRGALPERSSDGVHYPGTYLAGIYNRVVSTVHGRQMEEEHLVNIPNWSPLDVRIGNGPWWSSGQLATSNEHRELDLRRGVLLRRATLAGVDGHRLEVVQRRLVSMHDPHLAALETTLTPVGWSGSISIRTGIDAAVSNSNVPDNADVIVSHVVRPTFHSVGADTVVCEVETSQSQIRIATAVRTVLSGEPLVTEHDAQITGGDYVRQFDVQLHDGQPLEVTKTAAIVTSRDPAISSASSGAMMELSRSPDGVLGLLAAHEASWRRLWRSFAVRIDADRQSQLVLNLHVFHLLQTISTHTAALDVGVPARGLHGEGYRGHIFWDELFVLPVIALRLPDVSAALLDYRWRRLDAARDAAREAGLKGALFPWQSGSDGREETPRQLYNVRSSRWMPDNSRRQRHVGLAVAYNAWRHFQATGDRVWLAERGAELLIEATRMFASLASYDAVDDRFHIAGVMGPDEYHDGYPDAPGAGLRDNTYTNVLVSWVCERAAEALRVLAGHPYEDLVNRMDLGPEEVAGWQRLSRGLAIAFHEDGILSQFDGYEDLAELDWAHYRATYGNIGRLDLILEAEDDSTNRYKLAKQADVLMLVHLLGPDVLLDQLRRLGYQVSDADLVRTVDYYLARTAHGSTLSQVVHASVLARTDRERAWTVFREALVADLDDTQGGTTREGIHLGAMAGTADLAVRSFAGLQIEADALTFVPRLPPRLRSVGFQVLYRGQRIDVSVSHERLRFQVHRCTADPVRIGVQGTFAVLSGGESKEFSLDIGGVA